MALLEVRRLHVRYGSARVLHGIDLDVEQGEIVGLLGANGAGKSTLLHAISGLVRPTQGSVTFDARELTGCSPYEVLRAGIGQVAEGRRIFRTQTVRANLQLGGYARQDHASFGTALERALSLFPVLRDKLDHDSSMLSGGEQQMLAIAQAMLSGPRLLMMDEPSLGLAPIAIWGLVERLREMRKTGLTLLIVEQQLALATKICDRMYFLRNGSMAISGVAPAALDPEAVRAAYV